MYLDYDEIVMRKMLKHNILLSHKYISGNIDCYCENTESGTVLVYLTSAGTQMNNVARDCGDQNLICLKGLYQI